MVVLQILLELFNSLLLVSQLLSKYVESAHCVLALFLPLNVLSCFLLLHLLLSDIGVLLALLTLGESITVVISYDCCKVLHKSSQTHVLPPEGAPRSPSAIVRMEVEKARVGRAS